MVQESLLDWASGWDYSQASDGVGTDGDMIGTTAGESNSITILTIRIAVPSSIAMALIRDARTSIIPAILAVTALQGIAGFAATRPVECIPALSAGSIMAEWRELILSADSLALAASTEAVSVAEVSTVAEASTEEAAVTEAEVGDNSVQLPQTRLMIWRKNSCAQTI